MSYTDLHLCHTTRLAYLMSALSIRLSPTAEALLEQYCKKKRGSTSRNWLTT